MFRSALEIRWGIRAYQGMVRAYIGLDRVKEVRQVFITRVQVTSFDVRLQILKLGAR